MQQNDVSPWAQARQVARTVTVVLAFVAVLFLVVTLQSILALLIFAVFFAYLMAPLVELAHRPLRIFAAKRRLPRAAAIIVVFLSMAGAATAFVALFCVPLRAQVGELARSAPEYVNDARAHIQLFHDSAMKFVPPALQAPIDDRLARAYAAGTSRAEDAAVNFTASVRYIPALLLIPFIAFFLLRDAETFRRSALELLPSGRARWRAREFFVEVNGTLAAYIRAQWIACAFVLVVCSLAFWALGIDYPLLLGVLSGAGEFFPIMGPTLALVVAAIFAAVSGVSIPALVVFWIALRLAQDYLVYPRLISKSVKMHPLAVILALLCGAQVAGFFGIVLAIPVVAVFSVAYRHMGRNMGGEGLVAELLRPAEPEASAPVLQETAANIRVKPRLFGMRVLVVGNGPDARELLVFVLRHAGAEVMAAGSAREALVVLQRERPQVMVSDIGMPDEDGFDLIRQVRALPADKGGRVAAAALTAYTTLEDRQRALNAGYQTHVGKPVDPATLISVVEELARENHIFVAAQAS